MPNLTVSAAGVSASVQAYPQGRIGYLTVTCSATAGDDEIQATDILNSAYSSGQTGRLLEVWDNGGTDLEITPGGVYVVPYIDTVSGNIKFRNSTTGALAAAVNTSATLEFVVAVRLGA
jgi:hypothetical protein